MKMNESTATNIERAQYHAWFHHENADGYVTVAKKTPQGKFKQFHYQPDDLAKNLADWLGEDVFFSQNTFYRPMRNIENIRQLRSLYIDLDFYLFNYDTSWVIGKLEHEFFGESIPEPNILIFSGQGLVLIWLLDPVPHQALPLWQSVQNHFLKLLAELGGDPKAADAARIFRIDGSVNSKNGAEVRAEYRHDHRYALRQIQHDYLPELDDEVHPPKKKKPGRKKKAAQLFNTYRLHHARMLDIVKLVELRNYEVTGYRETICFLYRYWLCCYTNDPVEALNQTSTLNLQFTEPLPSKEVERATRSAEKAWEARNNEEANRIAIQKGYPGAGYNLKNTKIIDWLDITAEEMEHLSTVIDANEKRRRKRIANAEMRREKGQMKRSEYIQQQEETTIARLSTLKSLLDQGFKRSEIITIMGISIPYYKKLRQKL